MEKVDCLVIGAGVIGLAIARQLQLAGREAVLVERHPQFGMETSSRNSEVIHAGIYYPVGSLKARLCVRGRALLYDYCQTRNVPHKRLGKLIVATCPTELAQLATYLERAQRNGVDDLDLLDADAVRQLEPELSVCGGLLSPSTGIVDSHSLMFHLAADIESAGGALVYRSEVAQLLRSADGVVAVFNGGYRLQARHLINCAGLQAAAIAGGLADRQPVQTEQRFCKGHYYFYSGASPFGRLVYPVAMAGGLGIHVTLDMTGQVRFGPDVRWVDQLSYEFDDSQRHTFIEAIRRYYPDLDASRLTEGYTGIRPKNVPEGAPDGDFVIQRQLIGRGSATHLLGIESPGLTAALAIAEQVAGYFA